VSSGGGADKWLGDDDLAMDAISFIGIVLALIAIFGGQAIEGGSIGSLLQLAAFVIVAAGTAGAVLLQSPFQTFLQGVRLLRWIIRSPRWDAAAAVRQIVDWAQIARKEGILALESKLDAVTDSFIRNGLQLLIDGFEPEGIRHALEVEMGAWEERQRAAARVWEAAGGYAPTIGILGAVLGLIHVMENLSDPTKLGGGIAVAFVATIYGVGSANLLFLPIAGKLKALIAAEIHHREMILDGLIGIANGENPKLIEIRLTGYSA
jgi:chemotaxis protein MotA